MASRIEHDEVVGIVRESLPEFAERNGIVLSERIVDNLANWVVSAMPRGVARCTCTGRLPQRDEESWACACTGACYRWVHVYDGDEYE